MIPVFEDALAELLLKYSGMDADEIISILELKLYALREEQANSTEEEE